MLKSLLLIFMCLSGVYSEEVKDEPKEIASETAITKRHATSATPCPPLSHTSILQSKLWQPTNLQNEWKLQASAWQPQSSDWQQQKWQPQTSVWQQQKWQPQTSVWQQQKWQPQTSAWQQQKWQPQTSTWQQQKLQLQSDPWQQKSSLGQRQKWQSQYNPWQVQSSAWQPDSSAWRTQSSGWDKEKSPDLTGYKEPTYEPAAWQPQVTVKKAPSSDLRSQSLWQPQASGWQPQQSQQSLWQPQASSWQQPDHTTHYSQQNIWNPVSCPSPSVPSHNSIQYAPHYSHRQHIPQIPWQKPQIQLPTPLQNKVWKEPCD